MPPPSDSGLWLWCSGDSSATQNVVLADRELGHHRLVVVGAADAVDLPRAERGLVELDRGAPAADGELGGDGGHRRTSPQCGGMASPLRRLREADRALLRRLDFDPEAGGTGILARSREDLEAALGILGLTD